MLVLSRHRGEKIVLPTLGITIEVVEIRGDKTRIGIVADKSIPVHREEVWERIQSEEKQGVDSQ